MAAYWLRINQRITQVQMLHIALHDSWRLMDVIFILTGKVIE